MSEKQEALDRLEEIRDELLELVGEAKEIIHREFAAFHPAADAYWVPAIVTAVTDDHEYLGSCMVTMDDSLKELAHECGS